MQISYVNKISKTNKFFILPLFEDVDWNKTAPKELKRLLTNRKNAKDFKAKTGETITLVNDSAVLPARVMLFGLGKYKNLKAAKVRNQAASIAKEAKSNEKNTITVFLPEQLNEYAQEVAEGFALTAYNPNLYLTGKNKSSAEKKQLKKVELLLQKQEKTTKEMIEKGLTICNAVNIARDLVNGPNNLINPDTMAEIAKQIAKDNKCKVTVFDKKQLEKMNMGAILSVNAGSKIPARLVIFEHKPAKLPKDEQPIVIVGKGVTFDSGGYNLKPTSAITNMKEDMAGAGAVFGLFNLLEKLNIQKHVIGITPLTENMIGSSATAVNDVITTYSGQTVEITNTDAEGRIILADAISYAVKTYKPKYLIDLATLTGACMVALGDRYAGLLGNNKDLIDLLKKSSDETDELAWHLPIHADSKKKMKGKIADLQNSEGSGLAGASKGAAFLENFVEKTHWAHLDIAGVAFVKDPKPYDHDSATGYGVRLLVHFLESL